MENGSNEHRSAADSISARARRKAELVNDGGLELGVGVFRLKLERWLDGDAARGGT